MNNKGLVWVHGDCLAPHNPVLRQYAQRPAVFVFDEEWLARDNISLKRIMFIYECLLAIPALQIRKGKVVTELLDALEENGCQCLVTVASSAPHFIPIVCALQQKNINVEILPAPAFVTLAPTEEQSLDLQRFSRYWQNIKHKALRLNESLF